MSSFSVAGTGISFDATDISFTSKSGSAGLEEITCTILVASSTDWGALFSLRSWNVSVRPIPGGDVVYVDIGGGAGAGDLNIDNLDSQNAVLTSISRDFVEPGSLRSKAQCTWLVVT